MQEDGGEERDGAVRKVLAQHGDGASVGMGMLRL